ncbi:PepSY domain-containing protein [Sinimarinibacterium thermocellulolyticum]|uniref:PepSY domain-containing protein n=1 Tax=Sinimarinibacterium thermocellulolyticum TaxID=3170016 RepID=A0ABV2AC28_9GAMM
MEARLQHPPPTNSTACGGRARSVVGAGVVGALLALAPLATPQQVRADQDNLLPRQLIEPATMPPRMTPLPRLREPRLSPADAAREVQRRHGGRVLSVQERRDGGYRVKILKDGEVRIYEITP